MKNNPRSISLRKAALLRSMQASCAALFLFSACASTTWADLTTSPAGGTLPDTISPVGGIVVDIVGLNGTRIMTVVDASTLYAGYTIGYTTGMATIGIATGFTSELISSLGGGISSASFRFTLYDGKNAYGQWDYGYNSLYINGTYISSFSVVPTVETSSTLSYLGQSGTSYSNYYYATTGTSALSTGTGFGYYLSTGYFSASGSSTLSALYSALQTGTLTFSMQDRDSGDNFVNYRYAYAGSQYEYVGYLPGINSPTLVLSNTWNTPVSLDYVAKYNTITTENCTISSLSFTPSSTLTISGTLTLSSGSVIAQADGDSVISGGYLNNGGSSGFSFVTNGNQLVSSVLIGASQLWKSGTGTLVLTGESIYSGVTFVNNGVLQIGDGTSGSIGQTGTVYIGGTGVLSLNMGANAVFAPGIQNNDGVAQVVGSNGLTISGAIAGSGAFYQNGTGTTVLTAANTYTGATTVNSGVLWIGDGTSGSIASASVVTVGAGATLGLASPDTGMWSHSITNSGTVVFQGPLDSYTYTGTVSGTGALVKAGANTLTVGTVQTYTGRTWVAGGTLRLGLDNALSSQSLLQVDSGAIADLGDFSQSISGLVGSGTILTGSSAVLTIGADNLSTTFSGVISGSGSLVKTGNGVLNLAGQTSVAGGASIEQGTLLVSGSVQGDVAVETNGVLVVNGTVSGDVDVSGYLGGSGLIVGNVTNQAVVGPGNSPGVLTISGDYTQSSSGVLTIQIASQTSYDRLVVGGSATLDGTLEVTSNKQIRTPYTILTTGSGLSGVFSTILADSFLKFGVVYTADSVILEPYYRYLSTVSGLTPNEYAVAKTLDAMMDTRKFYESSKLLKLGDFLNALSDSSLPGAFEMIVPTDYVILPDATFSLAQVQTSNLELRMEQIRSDYGNYTCSLNAPASFYTSNDGTRYINANGQDLSPAPIDRAWSFFMNGSGEFVTDKCSSMYDEGKYNTSGVSAGADFRCADYDLPWAAGVTLGYANTSVTGRGDGRTDMDSGSINGYATAFKNGYFINGILGGGSTNYDLKRESLGGIARGSTSGLNLNAVIGGGYSYTANGFSLGPIASLRFSSVQIDGFSERGSLAPLDIHEQSKTSFKSTAGFQASYEFPVESVLIKPHARLQWRHEYANDSRDITANYQAGDEFTVNGESIGSDSLLVDLGATVRFSPMLSVYAYYLGDIGSSDYTSNSIIGGMQLSF